MTDETTGFVIPEEAVEAAAKAACEAVYPSSSTGRAKAHDSWDEIEEWERDAWRATADAAISAALPHLRVQETRACSLCNKPDEILPSGVMVHPDGTGHEGEHERTPDREAAMREPIGGPSWPVERERYGSYADQTPAPRPVVDREGIEFPADGVMRTAYLRGDREMLRQRVAEALAEKWTQPLDIANRREDWTYPERPMSERVKDQVDASYRSGPDYDSSLVLRAPTCLEIADAILALLPTEEAPVYVVHHHDIEKTAEHFNQGYDEAQRQRIGGPESRNWLTEKVWPLLKDHIEPENSHQVADHIADALLSEADLSDLPTEEAECNCYPGGFSPETYEGPQHHCPEHGHGNDLAVKDCPQCQADRKALPTEEDTKGEGSCTCPTDADVTVDMRDETGQHLAGCKRKASRGESL